MQIKYKNKKIEAVCTDASEAKKKYGEQMADIIHLRIDQISAFDSVECLL